MKRENIVVYEPCHADWERMTRLERGRYCGDCEKKVHDLSQMTREEVVEVMSAQDTERLCVRYLYDQAGNIVLRPERTVPGWRLNRAKRALKAAAMAAATLPIGLTAACGGARMDLKEPIADRDYYREMQRQQTQPALSAVPPGWEVIVDEPEVVEKPENVEEK